MALYLSLEIAQVVMYRATLSRISMFTSYYHVWQTESKSSALIRFPYLFLMILVASERCVKLSYNDTYPDSDSTFTIKGHWVDHRDKDGCLERAVVFSKIK